MSLEVIQPSVRLPTTGPGAHSANNLEESERRVPTQAATAPAQVAPSSPSMPPSSRHTKPAGKGFSWDPSADCPITVPGTLIHRRGVSCADTLLAAGVASLAGCLGCNGDLKAHRRRLRRHF